VTKKNTQQKGRDASKRGDQGGVPCAHLFKANDIPVKMKPKKDHPKKRVGKKRCPGCSASTKGGVLRKCNHEPILVDEEGMPI